MKIKKTTSYIMLALTALLLSCRDVTGGGVGRAWVVSTFAGRTWGYHEGTGKAAQFRYPRGVAMDSSGNVYVADSDNHRIRKITRDGMVRTIAGGSSSSEPESGTTNGAGTVARFNYPQGVAVDSSGNVYVADTDNHLIRKITIEINGSTTVSTLAGSETPEGEEKFKNGAGTVARFNYPRGVAVDSSGNFVYVADAGNHLIRKITVKTDGSATVSTLAGGTKGGFKDGVGEAAGFWYPAGVAVFSPDNDESNNIIYVTDTSNHLIRRITAAGRVSTLAGWRRGFKDGTDEAAQFSLPASVAVFSPDNDESNNIIYLADYFNNRIRKITPTGVVTTLAGSSVGGNADGAGTVARFHNPHGVAVDSSGNIYVADSGNNRIRKMEYKWE